MNWYDEFDSVFFITIVSLSFGSIAMCVRYSLKSKCENINCKCFGMNLFIHRNVHVEEEIELRNPPQILNTDEMV